jgi:2-polyprenyl-6-methoxyphenol hydroxylase-like FAD-dependent oxidoreductase
MPDTPILIAGAGPTGLVLALSLTRQGIRVRIIDKKSAPGEASRAIVIHARTLEFYNQLGIADTIISNGIKAENLHLRGNNKEVASLSLKNMGEGLSAYPYALMLAQDDHEKLLVAELKKSGVEIEWNAELKSFTQNDNEVKAVISHNDKEETITASYLAGCDGAHSRVREWLSIGFPGNTYNDLFYVADVQLDKEPGTDLFINMNAQGFHLVFPVRSSGRYRLIGLIPKEIAAKEKIDFEDLRAGIEPVINNKVQAVNWFSTYRVHHRVANKFRQGRSFLLGDAGHVHSPVGGQGMNTGIGDAINLAWKLAQVIEKRAPDTLLDTYETERISFARTLVATTDTIFSGIVSKGFKGKFFRSVLMPHLLPIATGLSLTRRMVFKMVSQIRISYHGSALSEGRAGAVKAGDRLPWVKEQDNFTSLQSLNWQLHVYSDVNPAILQSAKEMGIPVHLFAADEAVKKAGIKPNSAFLLRPDGYIAFATCDQDAEKLKKFIEQNKLKFKT